MIIDFPKLEHIPALRELWKEAFGDTDEFLDVFFDTAFSEKRALCGMVGNDIACALYWFNCEDKAGRRIAYIYAVATAKAYRGQGLCHELMKYANEYLKEQGYAGSIVVPGSEGLFQLYTDMGYKMCGYIDEKNVTANDAKTQLCELDKYEYAKLRRDFLPHGGVIQEAENLDFLEKQAKFYSGDGFVMAGRKEDKKFYCAELLGSAENYAEILTALGCREGLFRTAKEGKPFAMYYGGIPIPAYFGIAFD